MKALVCLLLFSTLLNAKDLSANKPKLKLVMKEYLVALNKKDKKKLSSICTKKYMSLLQKNGVLQETFKKQILVDPKTIDFDLKLKKAARTKDKYFVTIKDKKHDHWEEYWYVLESKDGTYKIDDMVFLD